MHFIGIDVGTTSIKGAVLDTEQATVSGVRQLPFPAEIDGPSGRCEVPPDRIVQTVRCLIDDFLSEVPDCVGIVACGQMHGFVLTDAAGKAASNYISWKDHRSLEPLAEPNATSLERLRRCLTRMEIQELGNELRAGIAIATLFQMVESDEIALAGLTPAPLTDFVLAQLSGDVPTCEVTHAASLGALHLGNLTWHDAALKRIGLDKLNWPRVGDHQETAYEIQTARGRIPCYAPLGDHQCALLGTRLFKGELSINASTGAQVATIAEAFQPGEYQVRPYFDGQYINTITHIPAGRALNLLVDLLTEIPRVAGTPIEDPWSVIERLVREVADTDVEVDLAFYQCAIGNRGRLANLCEQNLRVGHLFRGSFENMTDSFFTCARVLSAKNTRLVLAGSLFHRFEMLRKLVADTFDLEYRLGSTEETMLGLLAYAMVVSRRVPSFQMAAERLPA